jgi:hypothetical protein
VHPGDLGEDGVVTQFLAHPRRFPSVADYVDGGVALVAAPYDPESWRSVREGWWWHVAAMVVFPPYAVVALAMWQRPSGQPLARRVAWAVLVTLGALVLVGLGAFVRFSRRWYWWHRRQDEVAAIATSAPCGGPLAHRAAEAGGRLVERVTTTDRPRLGPGLALPWLPAPWGSLRDRVAGAALRLHEVAPDAEGPSADVVARAAQELAAACWSAARSAERAARAERPLQGIDPALVALELGLLSTASGDAIDLDAARRALHEQSATARRMAETLARTEGRLRRLAAQAGEVAARAEELVWAPSTAMELDLHSLESVTDQLASVRSALDQLDELELATGAA